MRKKKKAKLNPLAKQGKVNAQFYWLETNVEQVRKLKCPICKRKTEARVQVERPTYCALCLGKALEKLGLKPMVDLGPVTQKIQGGWTEYAKGKIQKAL